MKRFLIILFLIISTSGCTATPAITPQPTATALDSTAKEAHTTLINFFALLNTDKYAEADALYGGSYEQLQVFNPDADPSDHAALWAGACEMSGLQCLTVRTATFKRLEGDTYVFQVEFNNRDGSLFVLGPCCGADETEMPPVSQFEYKVTRNTSHQFVVMDLPPYVP